jgi:peptide/nickel transport system permease protein
MIRRIAVRIAIACVILAAVSLLVFCGTAALPVDPVKATLGQQATPELIKQYRKQLGLNRPLLDRYGSWVGGLLHGDLGKSLPRLDPVWGAIRDRVRNTAALAVATLIILVPLALGLGTISALRRDSVVDHGIAITTLVLISMPEFVVGTFLVLAVAVWLGLLPPLSLIDPGKPITSQLQALVLPVVTLLAVSVAQMTRMVRAAMIDVLRSEYIRIAILKGVPWRRILLRHALPNALAPTLQILAFTVGWLIGGVVIVENVFQYPGLGFAVTSAVLQADLPTVEAVVMLMTGVYLAATLLADIGVIVLDPRLRRRYA